MLVCEPPSYVVGAKTKKYSLFFQAAGGVARPSGGTGVRETIIAAAWTYCRQLVEVLRQFKLPRYGDVGSWALVRIPGQAEYRCIFAGCEPPLQSRSALVPNVEIFARLH